MIALVVYDTLYGNTATVANAIAEGLGDGPAVSVVLYRDVTPRDVERAELIVVGSPTHAFRPTPEISAFLDGLATLATKKVAAFDTRVSLDDMPAPLRWAMKVAGFAADAIARRLRDKGGIAAGPPAGFLVAGKEGPLKPGEVERAIAWARGLVPVAAELVPATA